MITHANKPSETLQPGSDIYDGSPVGRKPKHYRGGENEWMSPAPKQPATIPAMLCGLHKLYNG